MTPEQALKAIEQIVAGEGTKSDKARALFAIGLEKTEVAELVPMNYSQAHSVWVKGGYTSVPRVRKQAGLRGVREDDGGDHPRPGPSSRRALHLTPSQIRFATQGGHEVVRVDKQAGAECYNCGLEVLFDLRYLAFVHKGSAEAPTDLEDRYE